MNVFSVLFMLLESRKNKGSVVGRVSVFTRPFVTCFQVNNFFLKYVLFSLFVIIIHFNGSAQDWEVVTKSISEGDMVVMKIDYDHDGLDDVLCGHQNMTELFLWRSSGDDNLQLETLTDTILSTLSLNKLDFNDDGLEDFVIANNSSNDVANLWLFVGVGGETYDRFFLGTAPDTGVGQLYSGDFDQDGDFDFFYNAKTPTDYLWLILNNGDGSFTQNTIDFEGQYPKIFDVCDADQNNEFEILFGYKDLLTSEYVLAALDFSQGLPFVTHNLLYFEAPFICVSEHVEADSSTRFYVFEDLDFFENDYFDPFEEYTVYSSDASYELTAETTIPLEFYELPESFNDSWMSPYPFRVKSDINQNGYLEIAFPGIIYELYSGQGVIFLPYFVIDVNDVGDFNQDGLIDFLLGNGIIRFEPVSQVGNLGSVCNCSVRSLQAIRYGRDPNPDIVWNPGWADTKLKLIEQRFDEIMNYYAELPIDNITQYWPIDIDDDGDMDVICSGYYLRLAVWNGEDFVVEYLDSNVNVQSLWFGDLDNDGHHDIIYFDDFLKRLEWSSDGYVFSSFESVTLDNFAIIDIENDGDKDIVYFYLSPLETVFDARAIVVEGNESFSNAVFNSLMSFMENLQVPLTTHHTFKPCDFDSDGDEDILFYSSEYDGIYCLVNDGIDMFYHQLIFEGYGEIKDMDFGDLDMDSDIDLVLCNDNDTGVSLLRQFDGSFSLELLEFGHHATQEVVCEDMNNDGDIDIVYGSSGLGFHRIGWLDNKLMDIERVYSYEHEVICAYDSVWFNGAWEHDVGYYSDTLSLSPNVDSIAVLLLEHHPVPVFTLVQINNALIVLDEGQNNYQWYLDGDYLTSNSGWMDVSDWGTGTYMIRRQDQYTCVWYSEPLIVDSIINVEENEQMLLSVFPNPAKDVLNVNSNLQRIDEIKLINLQGQVVWSGSYNAHNAVLTTDQLRRGTYIIEINTSDDIVRSLVVIN